MTLANLRLIRDVAHLRSVSKAARANEISQSAASQAIQEIERDAGVTLFDRSRRPLIVTAAGKAYVEYCRDVLRRHDELQASLELLKKQRNGKARLAAIYSVGLSEMAHIEERFAGAFPDGQLQVAYLRPERVWEAVVEDEADLGLMSYAESSREVIALPWRDEEMVVAVAPNHRLAHEQSIRPTALEGEQFIGFDDDLPIQSQIDRYFREHKVSVQAAFHFDNLQMIKEAVAHDAGISIMPKRVMREELSQGRIVALRLQPRKLYRPVRIIHRRRKVFNEVTVGLLALLQQEEKGPA
ncbi:MAG: LysR family transcriptional regulator [Acidobacteriaceae bacterium]|nr:LysR family transcriptional regulator [Acidobacteriaceae bacterium]MBV9296458.1 LysR family transcriptional regulator [Acidobacteriaceae bacterium]MBV9766655.1 LysR family transcriptional regulator [Acidobacteriaceae bacterium]